jgi:hypothetical protein
MATRYVAFMGVLFALGCSSTQSDSNEVSYGGAGGAPGSGGDAGSAGTGGAGAGGSSGAGIAGVGGNITTDGGSVTDGGLSNCATSTATATREPAALELVVDTSRSMNDPAPGSGQNKWFVTRDALTSALPTIPDGNSLGLFFYPGNNNGTCIDPTPTVPIAVLDAAHRQNVNGRIMNQSTNGGTPTHDAYMVGLNQLVPYMLQGAKFLVLITDGAPTYALNCVGNGRDQVDSAALIGQVQNAATGGIKTFVIGSPGSEPARGTLSQMASLGGTAQPNCSDAGPNYCHFDMTTQTDLAAALKAALAAIAGQVLTCNYAIPDPGPGQTLDPNKVNVQHNTQQGSSDIPRDPSDTQCNTGWNYSADKTQIVLCPDTCNRVKAEGGDIKIVFGCATKVF